MSAFIIAEAGVNHNGDIGLARELVHVARRAGADAIKFQTFRAEDLATQDAPKAGYQDRTTDSNESQFEMLKRLELSAADHLTLKAECEAEGIVFLSTPFDMKSLGFLVSEMKVNQLKLPSGEITNGPLLLQAARTGLPLILSTGMATLDEIRDTLSVLAFGMCNDGVPSPEHALTAYKSAAGRRELEARVCLLHCTSEYPAAFDNINLNAMQTMRDAFGLPVGISDHSEGIAMPIAATALGACVIEKHFTLDRNLPGPDHRASISPDELSMMVNGIRQTEIAMGHGEKVPSEAELQNRQAMRKSLVAECDISDGEAFTVENLGIKRPGSGASPMLYWDFLSATASRPYKAGELIDP